MTEHATKPNGREKVALYLRCSTTAQDKALQRKELLDYVKSHNYHIFKIYEDTASGSTFSYERDEAEDVIRDAKLGRFKTLLIWRIDRVAREVEAGLNILRRIEEVGVKIEIITQPYLNSADNGNQELVYNSRSMILMGAKMEHDNIKRRVRGAKFRYLNEGKWALPHIPPYGYSTTKDKKLVISEKQAKIVRKIYNLYILKNNSADKICDILNKENIPTPRSAKQWMKSTVLKILSNPIYYGKHTAGKKLAETGFSKVEQKFPPIITRSIWDKVQEMKRIKFTASPKNVKRDYLFRGVIKCSKCGWNLFGRSKRDYINYVGANFSGDNKTRCKPQCGSVSETKINRALVKFFLDTLVSKKDEQLNEMFARIRKQRESKEEVEEANERLAELKQKEERTISLFINGQLETQKKDIKLSEIDQQKKFFEDRLLEYGQRHYTDKEWERVKADFMKATLVLRKWVFDGVPITTDKKWENVKETFVKDKDVARHLINIGLVGTIYADFQSGNLIVHPALPDGKEFKISANLRTHDIHRSSGRQTGFDRRRT